MALTLPRLYAVIVFLATLINLNLFAQDTKQVDREEMYRRYLDFPMYVKGGTVKPHWMADGSSFWYAEGAPENTVIWKVDPVANTKEPLFDTDRLRRSLEQVLGHEPPYAGLPFDSFTYDQRKGAVGFKLEDRRFVLRLADWGLREVEPPSAEEIDLKTPRTWQGRYDWEKYSEILSPDGKWFAGVEDHNLYIRSTLDGRKVIVTTDGEADHEWLIGNLGWSPNSLFLAVTKVDYRGVPKIPLVHYLKPFEEVEWVEYAKSGQNWPQSELYIVDVLSGHKVRVATDRNVPRLHVIAWKPDSSEVYLLARSRYVTPSGINVQLIAVNPQEGTTRVILRPKTEGHFTLLPDSDRFLWMSFPAVTAIIPSSNTLYLYNLDGQPLLQLTGGDYPFAGLVEVDEDSGWVYYIARGDQERPLDEHLYRVGLDGGDPEQLTQAPGVHRIQLSPSKQYFLDTHSSVQRPPRVEMRRADGRLLWTLSEADVSRLRELNWSPGEETVVGDSQGKGEIRGMLYKPADFDPSQKYPLIQIIYPSERIIFQREFVPRSVFSIKAQAFAQLGFVTLVLGVSNRASYNSELEELGLAGYEIADSVTAIRQLAADRSYIDLDRIGIQGGSKGGFYSILAILEAPEFYDVAISINGVTDMAAHMYNHHYLGPPGKNPKAFEGSSVIHLADKLEGKLLLIHGTDDTLVPISHTMRMVDALIRAKKPFDMLIMPEEPHSSPNIEYGYCLEAQKRYFVEHLKP